MSRLDLTKVTTPATPAANHGQVFYSSTLNPAGMAWIDESGVIRRCTPPTVKLTATGGARTTATLTDETGLVFPLVSGTYYRFVFHILYITTATTSGLKYGLTAPAVTAFAAIGRTLSAADGASGEFQGLVNSSGDSVVATDAQVTGTTAAPNIAIVEGTILPSANGNLQVQTANEAAAGTVTIQQGSGGVLWEL